MGLDEFALCIPREHLPTEWIKPCTVLQIQEADLENCLTLERCQFRCRREVENDFAWKQIIPYVLTFNSEGELLAYTRHGTEKRLHQLWSVGVGGHVNQADCSCGMSILQGIEDGMKRECMEELGMECTDFKLLGIINEEETEVGHAHLGIVFSTQLPKDAVPYSDELGKIQFVSPNKVYSLQTELWSQLAIRLLFGFQAKAE